MQSRRIGRSALELSVVGFGTAQLRLVSEEQALATLLRGFELGVNWVHVSPDYEGAEELVARAICASGRDVVPVSDGSGTMGHFEWLFERSCAIFGRERLPLWGISCIDDQEFVGHDVWGARGMVESLLAKKRAGRIGATYCTTHGPPDYVARLITSGAFDAIMLAWNPLGFHVLSSYAASEGKHFEDLAATGARLFDLARRHGVALLAMKALAGGLLGRSRAFPPRFDLTAGRAELGAHELLRYALMQPGITAVVPGTATVEEAEENALAGHAPLELAPERIRLLEERVAELRRALCSRCGACESTCSRGLPISWLFREAYIWINPGDTFDAVDRLHYFRLQPGAELACATCAERTCLCPAQIDIPRELTRAHAGMLELANRGLLPRIPEERGCSPGTGPLRALVVHAEWSRAADAVRCRLWLENAGERVWRAQPGQADHARLAIRRDGRAVQHVLLRCDVHPGMRAHVACDVLGARPGDGACWSAELVLADGTSGLILEGPIPPGAELPGGWRAAAAPRAGAAR